MFTSGSKLLFGWGALAAVTALVYGATSGDYNGTILWATMAAVAVLLGGVLVAVRDADVPIPAEVGAPGTATTADTGTAAVGACSRPAGPVVSPSIWPMAGAVAAATLVLGTVTDIRVLLLGGVLAAATFVEWLVQAWSDRASADPSFNAGIRGYTLHPIEFPVLGAAVLAIVILGFSRVMLALSTVGSLVAFVGIAVLILLVATVVALRPRFSANVVAGLLALGGLGIIAGGVAGAVSGERDFHHDEEEVVGGEEAIREVGAKANTLGTVTVAGDAATISTQGGRTSEVLRVPKALVSNVLFVNGDDEPRRLVIDAGEVATDELDADGNAVVEPLEFATQLAEPGNVNFLTFTIPNAGTYEFRIEGEDGADPVVGEIVAS